MAIIDLGQFGNPKPSVLDGLPESLARGLQLAETHRNNTADEATAASLAATKAQNTQSYTDAVANEKANLDFKKNTQNRNYAYQTLKNWSSILNDKSPAEQEALKSSDHGKEIDNLIKTYLPEYYDKDNKKVITLSDSTLNKQNAEQLVASSLSRVTSGKGTPQDIALLKVHSKDSNYITDTLKQVQNQARSTGDKSAPSMAKQFWGAIGKFMSDQGDRNAAANTPPALNPVSSSLAPEAQGSNDDPLGILKR